MKYVGFFFQMSFQDKPFPIYRVTCTEVGDYEKKSKKKSDYNISWNYLQK